MLPTYRLAFTILVATVFLISPDGRADDEASQPLPAMMPNVIVLGTPEADPDYSVLNPDELLRAPMSDGGDLLRQVNGVSAGRMGGRGLEPIIRGQSQGRLNILLDGAYVFGACPNRMDPPSSFAAVETWDQVTVIKGVQTLLWGGGGTGGTVLYERVNRPLEEGISGNAGAASTNNGIEYDLAADLGWRNDDYYARTRGQWLDAGNYEDGDGNSVRSSYTEKTAAIALGRSLAGDGFVELGADLSRASDVLYPGAGMDAPKDNADTWRARIETPVGDGGSRLNFESWYTDVDHLMDNYSQRQLTAPMAMRVPSRSKTWGGRMQFEAAPAQNWSATFGLDYLDNNRDATRYQGVAPGSVDMVNSYLWPDVTLRQAGLVIEARRTLAKAWLTAALRYDHVQAKAGKAEKDPAPAPLLSADELYLRYYGRRAGDDKEDNFSGLLRFDRALPWDGATVFTSVSRTTRTADSTERFIASNQPMDPTQRWVGNPGLDPEIHRQADMGLAWVRQAWQLSAVAYVDDVKDYILSDRARGQDGILSDDGARIYRNGSARLYGAELEGEYRLLSGWRFGATAAWVHGENRSDSRPLPQIPPLNGILNLAYQAQRWEAGTRMRWATRQSRADDNPASGSGLDPRETPGHAVFDIFAAVNLSGYGQLRLGVDNLLDKNWADHLSRANQDPFNPDPVQVNEPGLTAWANWRGTF
ncbi:MAG: TonB-dependent copper receptor [Gammaproteobacteria bacterium]